MILNQNAQNQTVLLNNCTTNRKLGMTSHILFVKKWLQMGTMLLSFLQLWFMNFCNKLESLSLGSIMFFDKVAQVKPLLRVSSWLERLARDKHSSFWEKFINCKINYNCKNVYNIWPWFLYLWFVYDVISVHWQWQSHDLDFLNVFMLFVQVTWQSAVLDNSES